MTALVNRLQQLFDALDRRVVAWMRNYGIQLIRIALAIVLIWFGTLKLIGRSPVVDLVANTVYWFNPDVFVPFLGVWEILVGIGLLFRLALRVTLLFFWLQLAGTFLVLLIRPDTAFQDGNLLLLTMEGEFVIKNLILIAAGLVIGSTVRHDRQPESDDRPNPPLKEISRASTP